jgi:hypothetical protein
MRRRSFDALVSATGLVVAAVLLAASGLLFWANSFVTSNVKEQLRDQRITMPAGEAIADPAIKPYLQKYSGQTMENGDQAKAFADHYIKVHLKEQTGDRSYSQLSAASRANPNDQELAGLVQTAFRGETLRGMLLNAYAFSMMAKVAFVAAWIALGTGLTLVLFSVLGLLHLRRTPVDVEVHVPGWHPEKSATS